MSQRLLLTTLIAIIWCGLSFAQNSSSDTVYFYQNDEVIVTAFDNEKSYLDSPGPISVIQNPSILSFDGVAPVQIFNSISGIRFEQRAPASYRIAIRGSALRSPFGVRNVKVYWNGIPFTQPTGSTPFNLLDVSSFEYLEVLKGPTGSVYGAGTGGVILAESVNRLSATSGKPSYSAGYMLGDFGLNRFDFKGSFNEEEKGYNFTAKIVNQTSDGYREQSFFDRTIVELVANINQHGRHNYQVIGLISDIEYGISGGLNADQFAADPTQARQGNPFALGSVEANAKIDQIFGLAAFAHTYKGENGFETDSRLFLKTSDFENPFNLDYKIEDRFTWGYRGYVSKTSDFGSVRNTTVIGTEFQIANNTAENFENDTTLVGDINFSDELDLNQTTVFLKTDFDFDGGWTITGGVSFNDFRYQIDRKIDSLSNNPGLVDRNYDPVLVPRIGISKRLSDQHAIHVSLSSGFSAPTLEEVRTNEGSLNLDLEPEQGINYELGARGVFWNGRLNYDASLFYFRLNDAIVQLQAPRGTTLFTNSGSTDQIGFELNTSVYLLDKPTSFLQSLNWQTALTIHRFTFDEYVRNGNDFSGNDLTGVAPNIVVNTLFASFKEGIYLNLSHNFTDEIPLDDGNTVFADSYHLVQAKTGIRRTVNKVNFEIFLGVDNLLDETYSLGNDLNAFGGRYFQPAATRNFYGGLKFTF